MRIQLLSDLHLETESFDPFPVPGADVLVLAGDIDTTWEAYRRFRDWPVPVLVVAGNHEFDRREVRQARSDFSALCGKYGLTLLECSSTVLHDREGRGVRFLGATRWTDFRLFGVERQARAMKAGTYFQKVMQATIDGQPFDAARVAEEGAVARRWLGDELQRRPDPGSNMLNQWASTVVITHFAPSLRSGDPRYGDELSTASFCNADDDLVESSDLWLHGHVHCRHDYAVPARGGRLGRVVSQARGLHAKGETAGYDPFKLIEVCTPITPTRGRP